MSRFGTQLTIRDPEDELEAVYQARLRPFRELGHAEKIEQYEQALQVALSALKKARERGDDHAA